MTSRLFCPLFTLCLPSQSMGWKLYSYFLTIRRLQSLILVESIRFHLYFSLIFLGWRRLDSIISLGVHPKITPKSLEGCHYSHYDYNNGVDKQKLESSKMATARVSSLHRRQLPMLSLCCNTCQRFSSKIFSFNGFSAKRKLGLKKIQQQHLFLMGNFFIISLL